MIPSSFDEQVHLLEEDRRKGRCWCCWEEDETANNPLIRVCKGCKDLDLQWIHQDCIDRYISLLPPPRTVPIIDSDQDFACTRCKDPYIVESRRTHPLIALKSEPFLFPSMIIITLCMIVLTASCISLIIDNLHSGFVFYFDIPIWMIGMFMLLFCHMVNTATWILVIQYCSGRWTRHVLQIKEDN